MAMSIKDLDADLAKLVTGAARRRVLVYTLIEYPGIDATHITTAYIDMDYIEQDSVFMSFAKKHLPLGTGQISAVYKKDTEEWGHPRRWFTKVDDNPVDFDVEEGQPQPEPCSIDTMIAELDEVDGYLIPPLVGFVECAITATFVLLD